MAHSQWRKAQCIVGLFIIAHFIFIFWHPGYMWGIDFLSYYSTWEFAGVGALCVCIFLPAFYTQQTLALIYSLTTGIKSIGLIIVMGLCFVFLTTSIHLLGDGALFLRELAALREGEAWVRPNRSPLIYALIQSLYHLPNITPLLAYQMYSWTSGILYVCATLLFSKKVGKTPAETALLLLALLSTGFIVQFFGYVENYALLFPAILTFLLLGLLTLQNKCHIFIFSAFTGLLFPIHFIAFSFLPALCVMLYLTLIKSQTLPPLTRVLKIGFCLLLTAWVSTLLFLWVDFNFIAYLQKPKQSHLLPFFSTAPYGFFSVVHLLDILNLFLLTSPFACLVLLFLLPYPNIKFTPPNIFLISATIFPLALIAISNPEIGFFRDWDIYAIITVPLTVLLFFLFREHSTHQPAFLKMGTLFVLSALFHTLLWVGTYTHKHKSIQRYEAILESEIVPPVAAAFSWETLGILYFENGDMIPARKAYINALKNDPKNARYINTIGVFYQNNNDTQQALHYFKQALTQNPNLAEAHANIGEIYFRQSMYDSAQYYYEKAFQNGLEHKRLFDNLGATHQALGNLEQAQKWFDKSVQLSR